MGSDPGESMDPRTGGAGRDLERAPSARYAAGVDNGSTRPPAKASIVGTVARAAVVAVVGSAVLIVVGAILASTAGLLFVSGVTGAGVGLVLARARVSTSEAAAPLTARIVTWLAIGVALAAVVAGGAGTWLIARAEGGTLGPLDYLLTVFGPFVPGEAIVAALGAAWGAQAGPIAR